jgi:hypothetical protein
MHVIQELWWKQAKSDYDLFIRLRRMGVEQCHLLHYLQMTTEKLSKAYFWRTKKTPPKIHTGFVRFLKALLVRNPREISHIAKLFGFTRPDDMDRWVSRIHTLAYQLQNTAPAEAGDGPNPEYPWPHDSPKHCPAGYEFPLWRQLADTGEGRKLMDFIGTAVRFFPEYA